MARPGVVGVCDTAAAAERTATPTRGAAGEFGFTTFDSRFAAETITAGGAGKGAHLSHAIRCGFQKRAPRTEPGRPQALVLALRPAILDRHVLALEASLLRTLAKRGDVERISFGRCAKSDN